MKYVIFDTSEINKINFDEVKQTSSNSLRKSIDNTKTFVKYDTEIPKSIELLETKSIEYSNTEILNILENEEWKITTNSKE
jgi:hypothetical protein